MLYYSIYLNDYGLNMPTDYEQLYQEQRHALGKPTKAFVDFFNTYEKQKADVIVRNSLWKE